MAETNGKVYSNVEILEILYNLKSLVQKYRSGNAKVKVNDILQGYAKAVGIAAAETGKSSEVIWGGIMAPLKKMLVERITQISVDNSVKLPKGLDNVFDADKLKALNSIISKIAKNQSATKKLNSDQSEITPKPMQVEEPDSLITRLKREAVAGLNSPRLKLSEEDKQKYAEIINSATEITIKRNALKCEVLIEGLAVIPSFGMSGTADGITSITKNGTPSTYGNLTKEDVAELISKKTKKFKTAAKAAAEKEAETAAKQQKARASRLNKLEADLSLLQDTALNTFKDMVASVDAQTLFTAFALDNKQGRDLLKVIFPNQPKENGGMQDKLKEYILNACIQDKNVWSLYMDQKDKNGNQRSGFYESLPNKILSETNVDKDVAEFMDKGCFDQKEINKQIDKIAGNLLPREIAQEMFIKSVFNYGMALNYNAKFTPEKFNNMNTVLEPLGYRIAMQTFTAQRECSEGAKAVSGAVLDDMHQNVNSNRNKELALLYHMGQYLSENKDYKFSQYDQKNSYDIYAQFANIYYDAPLQGKTKADYLKQWENFTQNKNNRQIALQVYNEFHNNQQNEKQETKTIKDMSNGRSGMDAFPLAENSIHHYLKRMYAGVMETVSEIKQKGSMFNPKNWLSSTICWHPADKDPHKTAHLLDTKEIYHYMRDGQYYTGSISGIRKGDTVYVPVLEVKGENGNFSRAIAENTLLVTSDGIAIPCPNVPGKTERESFLGYQTFYHLPNLDKKTPEPARPSKITRQRPVSYQRVYR